MMTALREGHSGDTVVVVGVVTTWRVGAWLRTLQALGAWCKDDRHTLQKRLVHKGILQRTEKVSFSKRVQEISQSSSNEQICQKHSRQGEENLKVAN